MRERRKIPKVMWLIALGCLVVPGALIVLHRPQPARSFQFPYAELAKVDSVVQARFAVTPTDDFGMDRMMPRHALFHPVTIDEQIAIDGLRTKGLDVVFYMAPRHYITGQQPHNENQSKLQGPIYMTQPPPLVVNPVKDRQDPYYEPPVFQTTARPTDIPATPDLQTQLRPMLMDGGWLNKTTPDGANFKWGDWDVVAAPVRASGPSCIGCHSDFVRDDQPKIGDPLGIALYAYKFRKA